MFRDVQPLSMKSMDFEWQGTVECEGILVSYILYTKKEIIVT